MFQAVIFAGKNVVYVLLLLAEKSTVNFIKPAESQKNYGLGTRCSQSAFPDVQ